jgi:cytochrome c biogenesis protein CcmG/thiol:disulfide interchange protein DsbE
MRRRRSWIKRALPPAMVALAMAALAVGGCAVEPDVAVGIGSPMPAFELPALEGGSLSSEALLGRPVILNFWATWCQPCRKEFPVLNALHQDPGVEVVTIALDEEGEKKVAPFVRREGLNYKVLLGDQKSFERFGGFTIPYTLVIDPAQTIVGVYRGQASAESLERDLRRIAGDAAEAERGEATDP